MFIGGFLRQSNYHRKKGTVVWPSVRMFGASMSLDCFGGFLDQIMTKKKPTVIWPLVAMFGSRFHELGLFWWVRRNNFWQVPQSNYKLQPGKKVHLSGHWLECLLGTFDLLHPTG